MAAAAIYHTLALECQRCYAATYPRVQPHGADTSGMVQVVAKCHLSTQRRERSVP